MAADIIQLASAAPEPFQTLVGQGRGNRTRIVLDMNEALAPCVEGIAFADEVVAHVDRLLVAVAAGSRRAVITESDRLADRALRYRTEFARLSRAIEPTGDVA